jgi:putative tricarboxylic transport membrane protein
LLKRLIVGAVLAACTIAVVPAHAEIKNLEIIAPANTGGGYDQQAPALQQDLNLASGVQVMNVPGAAGTIGLSQFVTAKKRNPSLIIGGLGMIGAILTNKAPVTLDQVTPLARLTGEYQPLVVAANSLQDLIDKFKADPGSVSWDGFSIGSPDQILSALVIKAAGGDVRKMNYIASRAGGELMAALLGNHITGPRS